MKNWENLLEKVKKGFASLNIAEKYTESALKNIETWLTQKAFEDYVPQIKYLIESEKWDMLLDSFYQVIPFGTGGRRGLVGIGTNRINVWTIQASAQGHSQFLISLYGQEAKTRGIVFAYDVRKYTQKNVYDDSLPNPVMNLDCMQLALAAAQVYAANGIKVFMFDSVRSTPELSFAVRHLKAAAGNVFSASHNLPTDNGKKVYDDLGGQLIPPEDQNLVDEVTNNVKEIKTISIEQAKEKGLFEYIGTEIDEAYYNAACSISLSKQRNIKILYSPLHGTGITSVFPVLKNLGFDIEFDPQTSNLNGKFENVTFNIPNPEVVESFDTSIPAADKINADIIINTDPDADRVGIMVKHNGEWKFLNGNETGILLTAYAIEKYITAGKLNNNSVIIKTDITTSLIEKIALQNNIRCIGNLLTGFKYIASEIKKLEEQNQINDFVLGIEESHGYITGNYCRDKDAAIGTVWIAELASELKNENKTLFDCLDDIYSRCGYCLNYLTEIRLLGAKGKDQIAEIMEHLRQDNIKSFGSFLVTNKNDRWDGSPHLSETDTSSRNMIIFDIKPLNGTQIIKITVRPSGTEPKIKMYFEIFGVPFNIKDSDSEKNRIKEIKESLEKDLMQYCYKIIGIDFPQRGFLLFWQLPLNDKLKYFEIESEILKLKKINDPAKRKQELYKILEFLGANPIEKVDKAFKAEYKTGILEYLKVDLQ